MISIDARKDVILESTNYANGNLMDRSLKGLLMDKGHAGLSDKLQDFLGKIILVQNAMGALVEQQRISRENSGSQSLDLYLALNLRSGRDKLEAEKIKALDMLEIQLHHTRSVPALEWRAHKTFALTYGYAYTTRIHAFNPAHLHYAQVRDYLNKSDPAYYEVLAGYDAIRVTLNFALKNLRKTVLDLSALGGDTIYPIDIENAAENLSRRIFKNLPESESVARLLSRLYC